MKLAIVENHQPLPVGVYGGIERISLFHFLAQCELRELSPVLICLQGSRVEHPGGEIVMLAPEDMTGLLQRRMPLRTVVADADILLTNNAEERFPIDLDGTKTVRVCVCHGDAGEMTNNTYQFFLTRGQLEAHRRAKPDFDARHRHVFVVPNGLDPRWYRRQEGPKNQIIWFSAMDERKSPHVAGEIAESLQRMVIAAGVGNPGCFGSPRVQYVGAIASEDEKSVLFSYGEVYIHTAQHPVFNDPCPTTVLEAQMCGVPVVGLRSGGVEDIVYDRNLIFDDVPDMIECLRRKDYLALDPARIREWCADVHSHTAMARRYNRCFDEITGGGTARP